MLQLNTSGGGGPTGRSALGGVGATSGLRAWHGGAEPFWPPPHAALRPPGHGSAGITCTAVGPRPSAARTAAAASAGPGSAYPPIAGNPYGGSEGAAAVREQLPYDIAGRCRGSAGGCPLRVAARVGARATESTKARHPTAQPGASARRGSCSEIFDSSTRAPNFLRAAAVVCAARIPRTAHISVRLEGAADVFAPRRLISRERTVHGRGVDPTTHRRRLRGTVAQGGDTAAARGFAVRGRRKRETPLYLAAVSGRTEIVRLLLEAGATPDTESRGQPGSAGLPLCAAASWDHDGVVRELLAHGTDPDRREDDGTAHTPLLWAAGGGHHGTAVLLLTAHADPDAALHGHTPLMAAGATATGSGSGTASAWYATTTGAEHAASAVAGPPSRFSSGARSLCRRGPSPAAAPRRHVTARRAAGTGC